MKQPNRGTLVAVGSVQHRGVEEVEHGGVLGRAHSDVRLVKQAVEPSNLVRASGTSTLAANAMKPAASIGL